jgi:methionyl-tRNA synthetase
MPEAGDNEIVDIDYFKKIKLVVGKVVSAENVEKSNKLLKLTVSFGSRQKTILSGIKKYYKTEDLVGKKVIVIDNLKPANLMGMQSEGMLLAADDKNGNLSLLTVDRDLADGSEIS